MMDEPRVCGSPRSWIDSRLRVDATSQKRLSAKGVGAGMGVAVGSTLEAAAKTQKGKEQETKRRANGRREFMDRLKAQLFVKGCLDRVFIAVIPGVVTGNFE